MDGDSGESSEPETKKTDNQLKLKTDSSLLRMVGKILELVTAFVIATISTLGYGGIVLLMAIESACIPLPSEIIMPFSGYLVYTGRFNIWLVAVAGAFGCVVWFARRLLGGHVWGPPADREIRKVCPRLKTLIWIWPIVGSIDLAKSLSS
jgi:hypothetical protein